MGIIAPWGDSLEVNSFQTVKTIMWINPMSLSAPREESLDIISLQTVK